MKESIGLKKLKLSMETIGYKKVCELTGLKPTILYEWLNYKKDPKNMKMLNARQIKFHLHIDYEDWFKSSDC